MEPERKQILKELAGRFINKYYPEYSDNVDMIWNRILGESSDIIDKRYSDGNMLVESGLGFSGKSSRNENLRPVMFGVALFALTGQDNRQAIKTLDIPSVLKKRLYGVIAEHFCSSDGGYSESVDAMTLCKMVEEGIAKKLESKIDSSKKEIINHIRKPVYDRNFKVHAEVRLCKGSFAVSEKGRFKGKGVLEIDSGMQRIESFRIPAIPFVYLYVLALGANDESVSLNARFYSEKDIASSVAGWGEKNERYVAKVKELLLQHLQKIPDMIEKSYNMGSRISTNPENIFIEKELDECLSGHVSKNSLTENARLYRK